MTLWTLLVSAVAAAQPASIVKDIYPGSSPQPSAYTHSTTLVRSGALLYFTADAGGSGSELWKTDATAVGTSILGDLIPDSQPVYNGETENLTDVNGSLYFTTWSAGPVWRLWKTDGTPAGTVPLLSVGGELSGLVNVGGTLFFMNQADLWKSDGTPTGTVRIATVGLPANPYFGNAKAVVGNTLFFAATEASHGTELWKSDGTEAGTGIIKDIYPGEIGSGPSGAAVLGTTVFFSANDGQGGIELWKSDGTEMGTVPVKEIQAGPFGSNPYALTPFNGILLFVADDGIAGSELWRTDGTEGGTTLVRDIVPGKPSPLPQRLTAGAGTVFFTANDGPSGFELWKSDGTYDGTVRVADVYPGATGSLPTELTLVGSTLFFNATDPTRGRQLWKSDGTELGTVPVRDVSARALVEFQDGLVFFGNDAGANHLDYLWKSDGSPSGTSPFYSFDVPAGSSPQSIVGLNNVAYFLANSGIAGKQVWKTDGTAAGTQMLTAIDPYESFTAIGALLAAGTHAFFQSSGYVWSIEEGATHAVRLTIGFSLNVFAGSLFFFKSGVSGGIEMWKSDGTPASTQFVKAFPATNDFAVGPIIAIGGIGYFSVRESGKDQLWKTDGTTDGTVFVKEIESDFGLRYKTALNGILYFMVDAYPSDTIWRSDGTAEGTYSVIPLPGENLTVAGGSLFFTAYHPMTGVELWKTDGTLNGTFLVKDIFPGTMSSDPSWLAGLGSVLYFAANDGIHGAELWRSDGTPEGTTLVRDIRPGSDPSVITRLTVSGGVLFFSAADPSSGTELFKSDGTPGGTLPVKDINPGAVSSGPDFLADIGGTLFFSAFSPEAGRELWKSDGSPQGTVLVKDLNPSLNNSAPGSAIESGGILYFTAGNAENGRELWKSDGTAIGTLLVKDIIPGKINSFPRYPLSYGGKLIFSAQDEGLGFEPFISDGTEAGTSLLKDVRPGSAFSSPFEFVPFGGKVYFTADDGTHGRELWVTDGTSNGTSLFKDLLPGSVISNAGGFVVGGPYLYFQATAPSGFTGSRALWRTDGTPSGTIPLAGFSQVSAPLSLGGDEMFFLARTSQDLGVWKTDGTPAGTQPVSVISTDPNFIPGGSWRTGSLLTFFLRTGQTSFELWKSDGSAPGTVLVKAGFVQPPNVYPTATVVGEVLFFVAGDEEHGGELWRSNGTAAGTVLVKDVRDGPDGSGIGELLNVGGKLLFRANDGAHGSELWVSDGTELGTSLLQDINPGQDSSWPGLGIFGGNDGLLTIAGTRVYFSAVDPDHGQELWSLPMSAVCAPPAAPTILSSGNPNCGAVTLDAGPGYAGYLWSTGETTRTITVSPSAATTYTVYVSNAAGCRSSASLVQVGKPVPAPPVASNSGPVCEGEPLQLSASTVAGATYAWTGPGGFTSAEQNPLIPSGSTSGTYSVTVTVDSCTSAPATTGVVVNPLPVATISRASVVCAGQAANRASVPAAGPGAKYEWVITNGTITSGAGSSSVVFTSGASGTVQLGVTVTSGAGCAAQSSADIATVACAAEPRGLVVDGSADGGLSDGNQVLEPGETVLMSPFWKNLGGSPLGLTGTASAFTGPVGAAYTLGDSTADYGSIAGGATGDCATATGDCYELSVSNPPTRPAGHWDAVVTETLSDGDPAKTWPLHIGQSFTDVPKTHTFYQFVERLLHSGVTTGCGPGTYCPEDLVSRLQMAIFIARAQAGGDGNVPSSGMAQGQAFDCKVGGASLFSDIAPENPFCRHVHAIYAAGVTTGCEPGKYCPDPSVSRAQIAMFIARAMAGGDAGVPQTYGPDPITGRSYSCNAGTPNLHFTDVTTTDIYCRHTHYLWAKDVISGFPDNSYGPALDVGRGAMAKFLSNGFALRLYGP